MNGLMMDYQLSVPPILHRAETFFGDQEVVTRLPDKSFHRYTFARHGRSGQAAARPPCRSSASNAVTGSPRCAGTTIRTWRRTSGSRAAGSCSTR